MKIKIYFIIVFTILQTSLLFSQGINDNISLELRYPFPLGDNFLNNKIVDKGYYGLIDIGLDYSLFRIKNFGIGILVNTSIYKLDISNLTLMVFSPKMKFEYNINFGKFTLIPQLAVGYSNWRFRAPTSSITDESGNVFYIKKIENNENGLSFKGSSKLVFDSSRKMAFYIQVAYEFTRLEKPTMPAVDSKYNRNLKIIYPVVGMLWKFK
jgi:hypothetical protein